MSDLVAVRGEFTAQDWQIGLFAEKDRVSKQFGENGNICSVVSFEYKGSIDRLNNHVPARMSYLKEKGRSVGEIVRLKKPVGYIRVYLGVKEVKEKGNENFVNIRQMLYACHPSATRFCILELRNGTQPPQYKFLKGHRELLDAKREVFGIIRSNNTVFGSETTKYYYIYDLKEHKVYCCYPGMEELKTTTRSTNDEQIIAPVYRYIYYGYAEPKKIN